MRWLVAVLAAFLLGAPASAHLLPSRQATINVVGDRAYLVVSLPRDAFSADGTPVLEQFRARFAVSSDGKRADLPFAVAMNDPAGGDDHFVFLAGAQFDGPPRTVSIRTDLFGSEAPGLSIRARRGTELSSAVIVPPTRSATLFAPAPDRLVEIARIGFVHIFTGIDHLLFLLALLAGAASARSLLGATVAFALAHSITLGGAAAGLIVPRPALVEPAVALTIALVAGWDLFARGRAARWRLAAIFACGLIHGMGFAGALLGSAAPVLDGAGAFAAFMAGLEAGQIAFLLACILVANFVHGVAGLQPDRLRQAASAISGLSGLAILVARIA